MILPLLFRPEFVLILLVKLFSGVVLVTSSNEAEDICLFAGEVALYFFSAMFF